MIDCGPHGMRVAAVVCRHMVGPDAPTAGFIENRSDQHDLQAWCFACEEEFQDENGMTDAFLEFNDMKVVCVDCYADAKLRHSLPTH